MAQSLFDALAGVSGMDSQTALAVQSLLDSQTPLTEAPTAVPEEEDVFQCGKCKKQFTSLSSFVSHKQSRCTGGAFPTSQPPALQQPPVFTNSAASLKQPPEQQVGGGLGTLPPYSSHQQLSHSFPSSIVLTDDLISFPDQTPIIQVGAGTMQGNPLLSQTPIASHPSPPASSLTPQNPTPSSLNMATSSLVQIQPMTSVAQSVATVYPTQQQTVETMATASQQLVIANLPDGAKGITLTGLPVLKPHGKQDKTTTVVQTQVEEGAPTSAGTSYITVLNREETPTTQHTPRQRRTKAALTMAGASYNEGGEKKKLSCTYCDKAFAKNFDLQQHMRSHTGEKPFQCIVCGRAFAQKSNVKKHMQTHKVWPQGTSQTLPEQPQPELYVIMKEPKKTTETVDEGQKSGEGSEAVVSHIVVDNSFICQYCGEKFKTYFMLKSHMVQHKSEQVYKCILKMCGGTFKELDAFLEHTKSHEQEMTYRCHICNRVFPSLYELGVHQYSHSLYPNQGPKTAVRLFRCTKCGGKYASPEALHHHMETVNHHFECPHCKKIFTCERYLRRHLPIHGTVGEYECEVCHKTFKTEHYLKMHSVTHSQEKPFHCEQCEARFNRRDKLKRHMLIHETVKKFKCPFASHTGCTKEFNRPDKLKAHILTHSGIRPYKCDVCMKFFARRSNLEEHKRLHRNLYRFQCNKCNRKFQRLKMLQSHQCHIKAHNSTVKTVQSTEQNTEVVVKTEDTQNDVEYVPVRGKRKVGRPRKRMIHVTKSTTSKPGKRGRPRKIKDEPELNPQIETVLDPSKDGSDFNATIVSILPTDPKGKDVAEQNDVVANGEASSSGQLDGTVIIEQGKEDSEGTSVVITQDGQNLNQYYVIHPYMNSSGALQVSLQPHNNNFASSSGNFDTQTFSVTDTQLQSMQVDGTLSNLQGATFLSMGDDATTLVVEDVHENQTSYVTRDETEGAFITQVAGDKGAYSNGDNLVAVGDGDNATVAASQGCVSMVTNVNNQTVSLETEQNCDAGSCETSHAESLH